MELVASECIQITNRGIQLLFSNCRDNANFCCGVGDCYFQDLYFKLHKIVNGFIFDHIGLQILHVLLVEISCYELSNSVRWG